VSDYFEKLRDPRWQKKRLKVMERDNWTCQICNVKESTLNVHHTAYIGDPWDIPDRKLVTFCEQCHKNCEDILKKIRLNLKTPRQFNATWKFAHLMDMGYEDELHYILVTFMQQPKAAEELVFRAQEYNRESYNDRNPDSAWRFNDFGSGI
jgi:hypothetical protein